MKHYIILALEEIESKNPKCGLCLSVVLSIVSHVIFRDVTIILMNDSQPKNTSIFILLIDINDYDEKGSELYTK